MKEPTFWLASALFIAESIIRTPCCRPMVAHYLTLTVTPSLRGERTVPAGSRPSVEHNRSTITLALDYSRCRARVFFGYTELRGAVGCHQADQEVSSGMDRLRKWRPFPYRNRT